MNHRTFDDLESEKRERIIAAAMNEFTRHSFEQASTNRIVQEAQIGKGTLFYHFPTKQALFDYCVEWGLDFIASHYVDELRSLNGDFIHRYYQAAEVKMQLYTSYPHVFNFLDALMIRGDDILSDNQKARITATYTHAQTLLQNNLDTSPFRQDIPEAYVRQMIHWCMDGFQNQLMQRLQARDLSTLDTDPLWAEFSSFLDILRVVFYDRENPSGKQSK